MIKILPNQYFLFLKTLLVGKGYRNDIGLNLKLYDSLQFFLERQCYILANLIKDSIKFTSNLLIKIEKWRTIGFSKGILSLLFLAQSKKSFKRVGVSWSRLNVSGSIFAFDNYPFNNFEVGIFCRQTFFNLK